MLTRPKRKLLFWISVLIFIAMVPVVILYALGYRLDNSWRLQKTGGVYITADITGSEIFIDEKFVRRTNLLQNGAFIDNLTPGIYKILVLNENYIPWEKNLRVSSQLVTEAKALLIPSKTSAEILLNGAFEKIFASGFSPLLLLSEEKNSVKIIRWYNPETKIFLTDTGPLLHYEKNLEIIRWLPAGIVLAIDGKTERVSFNLAASTATRVSLAGESPIKSPEESEALLYRSDPARSFKVSYDPEKKILSANWNEKTALPYFLQSQSEVLIMNKDIKNFEFYPERRDAIIASYENGLWSIELDGRGGRIIEPIYKGNRPNFAITPGSKTLYILDNGILFKIFLRAQ